MSPSMERHKVGSDGEQGWSEIKEKEKESRFDGLMDGGAREEVEEDGDKKNLRKGKLGGRRTS